MRRNSRKAFLGVSAARTLPASAAAEAMERLDERNARRFIEGNGIRGVMSATGGGGGADSGQDVLSSGNGAVCSGGAAGAIGGEGDRRVPARERRGEGGGADSRVDACGKLDRRRDRQDGYAQADHEVAESLLPGADRGRRAHGGGVQRHVGMGPGW